VKTRLIRLSWVCSLRIIALLLLLLTAPQAFAEFVEQAPPLASAEQRDARLDAPLAEGTTRSPPDYRGQKPPSHDHRLGPDLGSQLISLYFGIDSEVPDTLQGSDLVDGSVPFALTRGP